METNSDAQSISSEDQIIAEEYRAWKKNSAFLYDFILARGLVWPSLTVQWLPMIETYYWKKKILIGLRERIIVYRN